MSDGSSKRQVRGELEDVIRRIRSEQGQPEQSAGESERVAPVNAFLSVAAPEEIDALLERAGGDREVTDTRLGGLPLAVKDNICGRYFPTTAGSEMLQGYESPLEATAVARLRRAGGVIVGKTNLDEFGMGSSTETGVGRPVRNPHNRARTAGGSSGGSAAAVAAGLVPAALGSDTGGSVRQPAAHCGVVGTKLTYGRIPRHGLIAFASSLDHIGTLTDSVERAAVLSEMTAGHDPRDSTSLNVSVDDWHAACDRDVGGLTIGVPQEFFDGRAAEALEEQVEDRVRWAIDGLASRGAKVEQVSLPHTDLAVAVYQVIATAEASSNLARYDGVRFGRRNEEAGDFETMVAESRAEGLGREVKRRIVLGTYLLSERYEREDYERARRVRTLIRDDYRAVFDKVDALVAPVTPTPAFELGSKLDDPMEMYLSDVFTTPANLAGIPAASVPVEATDEGLPVGVQVMAPWLGESTMFRVASAIEEAHR